jgi:hypothetical protein
MARLWWSSRTERPGRLSGPDFRQASEMWPAAVEWPVSDDDQW